MKTAVYLRVSSSSQTTASQEPDLKRWAKAETAAGCALDWYRDTFTGKTMDRPGWSRLWAGVLRGDYHRVVVWRLDRLGRTAREVIPLLDELQGRNVALISIREGFDLSTPGGRLFAGMLASFAQYETELRSERQLAGIAAAKERGVKFGRPKGQGGTPGKRIKVTAEQEVLIRELKSLGRAVAAIARATGLSRPTVYSVLEGAGAAR